MDSPPVPKPRTLITPSNETKTPVPLPRTKTEKLANNDKNTTSDIFRSISTVSKQLTEDMAQKVHSSAKTANEKIEKSFLDGTKLAKDSLERTLNSSRNVRDSLTKSVMESTRSAGHKLRTSTKRLREHGSKKKEDIPRCVSMPVVDVSLFDNLQFNSPLLDQKKFCSVADSDASTGDGSDILPTTLNSASNDFSMISGSLDTYTDSISNFSYDSKEQEYNLGMANELEPVTYDTPKDLKTVQTQESIHIDAHSAPKPMERRSKDEPLGFFRQNSLYENWNLPDDPLHFDLNPQPPRVSKSTIYEFDPLKTINLEFDGKSNELLLLESFLSGDNYGTVGGDDSIVEYAGAIENDSICFNPPTPPERFDSLPLEENESEMLGNIEKKEGKSNWFITEDTEPNNPTNVEVRPKTSANTSVMRRFSNILKFDTLTKSSKEKSDCVVRPPITQLPMVVHSGILNRIISGGVDDLFKNSQSRYCVISDQKLICYSDTTNCIVKESYTLQSIYSVQIVLPLSASTADNIYCFELNVNVGSKNSYRKVLFSCTSAAERHNWAQKIVEHLSDGFPVKYSAELTRFGWCYIREGVGAEWHGAWLMLIRRVLVYYTTKDSTIKTVDLRKTWRVVTQEADEATRQTCATDGSASLLLDNPALTLYIRFPMERELKSWRYMVKLAAHNNGILIHHQQLTKEDVPTIVDKCINFIYVHGSMSEGIYRRAGASVATSELLGRFRRDAWSVRLSKATHTEHDVSAVLKRFFRDLHHSLIPSELHDRLVGASAIKSLEERCNEYSRILSDLPPVAWRCARKLFAHLHFIHTLRDVNKMNAENLASVWAPTIMPAAITSESLHSAWSTKEVNVVRELAAHFPAVYKPSGAELERESAMLAVLRRVAASSAPAPRQPRSAGDLRIWVYLHDRTLARCEHVTLTPNKSCEDVCVELCDKMEREPHRLTLEEVVCGGALRRALLAHERLLDTVLRWTDWDEDDRKHNYLLLTADNRILHEMESIRGTTSLVCGELKFANEKSKTFKPYTFEIQNARLSYFKDKQGSCLLGEWNVKDHLWYVGCEPKRNPQTRWAITFIPKNNKPKRCKDRAWFGCTVAGSVGEEQLRWLAAITFAQHDGSLLPSPRLVLT